MIKNWIALACVASLLSGCGYKFCDDKCDIANKSIAMPYVGGDPKGFLTSAIIKELTCSSVCRYTKGDADLMLEANIDSIGDSTIGYRHDRNENGQVQTNIMPTESRKGISVSIKLIDNSTGKIVFGPKTIISSIDFDYINQKAFNDSYLTNASGQSQSTLSFSLGQLESSPNASDVASQPVYNRVAKKIVDAISYQW
jgi:hypothetical protein